MRINHLSISLSALLLTTACSQVTSPELRDIYMSGASIRSHPVLSGDHLYFGNSEGTVQCIHAGSGELAWEFRTDYPVQGSVLISEGDLYVSSGNTLYELDRATGEERWRTRFDFMPAGQLDYWDYHHSTPVSDGYKIYFGAENGVMYCLDRSDGKILYTYPALDSAAIRCTPVIHEAVLFFGDWNGRVYAFDTESRDTLWTHRTYLVREYPTFGQVNTSFTVWDSLLAFGLRNPELRVLNVRNGRMVWNHIETDGGWISGDPLISGDTLYIGGSDCHKMFAFNIRTGNLYWENEFLNNNFSAPVIWDNYLLFTTADAYSVYGTSHGTGYLYALERGTGSLVNFSRIRGNCLTTPVIYEDQVLAGSDDGSIYAAGLEPFLKDAPAPESKGYGAVGNLVAEPDVFTENTVISYQVLNEYRIGISVTDLNGSILYRQDINQSPGRHQLTWTGKDTDSATVPPGYYRVFLRTGEYEISTFVQRTNQ